MSRLAGIRDSAILLALCFISFFAYREVVEVDLMEARNFVTAREMVATGNWLVPTMNGEIRLAKPPLPTWLAALSAKLAGRSDDLAVLRLPNGLAATLMVFAAYGLGLAVTRNRRQAMLSAAMLATSVLAIDVGRTGTWDIFCHAFMMAGLWALWSGLANRAGIRSFILAGIGLGLSFMSKGPVAFYALLLPFTLAYIVIFGLSEIKRQWWGLTLTLIITLILGGWWPLYILLYHADLALLVAQKEGEAWSSRHVQPLWYYWHFALFTGGWLVLACAALIRPYAALRSGNKPAYLFSLLWLVSALVLLSLIPEKKERYLLPAMIPLLFMAADLANGVSERLAHGRGERADRALLLTHTALFTLLSLLLPLVVLTFLTKHGQAIDGGLVLLGLGSWAATVFLLRSHQRRQVERLLFVSLAFLALATLTVTRYYGVLSTENPGYKRIDHHLLTREIGQAPVYLLGDPVDMRVIWDLGQRAYPWQEEEVSRLLKQGAPVAVLSKGDPLPLLPKGIRLRGIDRFDYNKRRPDRHPIQLSLLLPLAAPDPPNTLATPDPPVSLRPTP